MKTQSAEKTPYKACSTQFFRAEFGVCRGETISQLSDLNLGDVYLVKLGADWKDVDPINDAPSEFYMHEAANVPQTTLVTCAELTFMTTTGRRADVFASMAQGQFYIVAETALRVGDEYVLIDIKRRDFDRNPHMVQPPAALRARVSDERSNVVPLRLMG